MNPKENVLLNARASVSWIYSNLLGKKANFELLHPTELKRAEEEYAAWTSYLLPIEEALSELETLKQEFIKLGDELEELKQDILFYLKNENKIKNYSGKGLSEVYGFKDDLFDEVILTRRKLSKVGETE